MFTADIFSAKCAEDARHARQQGLVLSRLPSPVTVTRGVMSVCMAACATDGDSDLRGQGLLTVLRCASMDNDVRCPEYGGLNSFAFFGQHDGIVHHSQGAASVSASSEHCNLLVDG